MSIVRARETFHHEGGTVQGGTELDADHPTVAAFPDLFDEVSPTGDTPRRGPGRPPGSKNKPKVSEGDADG